MGESDSDANRPARRRKTGSTPISPEAKHRRRVAFGRRFSRSGSARGWLRAGVKSAVVAAAGVGVLAYGATTAEALEHKRPPAVVEVTLAGTQTTEEDADGEIISDWTFTRQARRSRSSARAAGALARRSSRPTNGR
jgi:hypothetical protein